MIPKIVHYVWLGGGEKPKEIKGCIESWRRCMPEYEIREWNETNIGEIDYQFIREAISEKKWAFASDVIRLWALYNYGGIYLDTDVKVFKPFDDLLTDRAFTGRESSMHVIGRRTINYITTCCLAAEPKHPFIKRCLDYYDGRRFITSTDTTLPTELRLDMTLNSEVMCLLAEDFGYKPSVLQNHIQRCEEVLVVYPSSYFDPAGQKPESYCQHLALGTWREGAKKVWTYTLRDKITWRLEKLVNVILSPFNYSLLKLR